MPINLQSQAELIPGYRLLERLGSGGYGEVWKAGATGGAPKAIKVVRASLGNASTSKVCTQLALKALACVKSVRHPFLLALEHYELLEDRLVLIMELAERNLWDRYRECRAQGMPGIPRQELLHQIEEAAEVLDLLNQEHRLWHLNLKPQNLLLVDRHVKIGDFGLAQDLEGLHDEAANQVAPVYSAPETFDGKASSQSDQYSLAIVYQELLTGQRPFAGTGVRQLLMQHVTAAPNLDALSEHDRGAIGRALAKNPEARHASCSDLVQALRLGSTVETMSPAALRQASAVTLSTKQLEKIAAQKDDPAQTQSARKSIVTGDGVLFPALVIGLGGLGSTVLRGLRQSLHERCGFASLPSLRFLQIDVDGEVLKEAAQDHPAFRLNANDFFAARLQKATNYLKPRPDRVSMESWLDMRLLNRMPRNQAITTGVRALGRLAFVDNFQSITRRLQEELNACTATEALTEAMAMTQLAMRSNQPRVYVVAGLAGGTGSGMFLDVAYLVRQLLRQQGYEFPEVVGLFLVPDVKDKVTPALGNTYAALTEMQYFAAQGVIFSARYNDYTEEITDYGPPFSRCILLPHADKPVPGHDPAALAGDFLCRDLVTPLGKVADKLRLNLPTTKTGFSCQTFGAHAVAKKGQSLTDRLARRHTLHLFAGWVGTGRKPMPEVVKSLLTTLCEENKLGPEHVMTRLQAACEHALEQPPAAVFDLALHRFLEPSNSTPLDAAELEGILAYLEHLIGHTGKIVDPAVLPTTLDEVTPALCQEWRAKTNQIVLSYLEEPIHRLPGAEAALQQLRTLLLQVLQEIQDRTVELTARAADTFTQIHSLQGELHKKSLWGWLQKNKSTTTLLTLLQFYPRVRYEVLILEHAASVYRDALRGLEETKRELGFCRTRLTEAGQILTEAWKPDVNLKPRELAQLKLPEGCATVEEARARVDRAATPDACFEFDLNVQAAVCKRFTSLHHLCMTSAELVEDLEALVQAPAEAFVEAALHGVSSVELLKAHETEDEHFAELEEAFHAAQPTLLAASSPANDISILTTPADTEGERLVRLARELAPKVQSAASDDARDTIFYREQANLNLADLPQLGPKAKDAYHRLEAEQCGPHTRKDIVQWQSVQRE